MCGDKSCTMYVLIDFPFSNKGHFNLSLHRINDWVLIFNSEIYLIGHKIIHGIDPILFLPSFCVKFTVLETKFDINILLDAKAI